MSQPLEALIKKLQHNGIREPEILAAFRSVPRGLFVGEDQAAFAYEDRALSIACGQTISQPFIVARMTQLLLAHAPHQKILEIGTGSGYQAAILSQLVKEVYTVERIAALYQQASQRFESLGLKNIFSAHRDGYLGWPEHAPYDAIIVTAAATSVPPALLQQLVDGGRLVMPVGERSVQYLQVITRQGEHYLEWKGDPVIFVPLLTDLQ